LLFQKIFGEIPMNAENSMRERIDTMFRNDRIFAYVLLIGVWVAVWFVVDQVAALGPPGSFMGLVYLSALALCIFNTASIIAMVRHYEQAKEHIYRQDIQYLDAIAVSNKQHQAHELGGTSLWLHHPHTDPPSKVPPGNYLIVCLWWPW
jgi:hypothetical protein